MKLETIKCFGIWVAVFIVASAHLAAQGVGTPSHGANPPNPPPVALSVQLEAMAKYPELGRAGSPFNREFLARMWHHAAGDRTVFQNERWPVALADEIAAAGFPSVGVSATKAGTRLLLPSAPEWRFLKVYREGSDIVVPSAIATVFGWDTRLGVIDPNDRGGCASGRHTRTNPGLLGCALPVSILHPSTVGSPFPKVPRLPWFFPVVVTHNGKSVTVQLIDNGPAAPVPNDSVPAGIDLTPAACLALGISIDDIRRNRPAFKVSFRLPGAAL